MELKVDAAVHPPFPSDHGVIDLTISPSDEEGDMESESDAHTHARTHTRTSPDTRSTTRRRTVSEVKSQERKQKKPSTVSIIKPMHMSPDRRKSSRKRRLKRMDSRDHTDENGYDDADASDIVGSPPPVILSPSPPVTAASIQPHLSNDASTLGQAYSRAYRRLTPPSSAAASEADVEDESEGGEEEDGEEGGIRFCPYGRRRPRERGYVYVGQDYQASYIPDVLTEEQKRNDPDPCPSEERVYISEYNPDAIPISPGMHAMLLSDESEEEEESQGAGGSGNDDGGLNDDDRYEVRDILCKRLTRQAKRRFASVCGGRARFGASPAFRPIHLAVASDYEYFVSWLGYGSEENSWEPYENVSAVLNTWSTFIPSEEEYKARKNSSKKQIRKRRIIADEDDDDDDDGGEDEQWVNKSPPAPLPSSAVDCSLLHNHAILSAASSSPFRSSASDKSSSSSSSSSSSASSARAATTSSPTHGHPSRRPADATSSPREQGDFVRNTNTNGTHRPLTNVHKNNKLNGGIVDVTFDVSPPSHARAGPYNSRIRGSFFDGKTARMDAAKSVNELEDENHAIRTSKTNGDVKRPSRTTFLTSLLPSQPTKRRDQQQT